MLWISRNFLQTADADKALPPPSVGLLPFRTQPVCTQALEISFIIIIIIIYTLWPHFIDVRPWPTLNFSSGTETWEGLVRGPVRAITDF